MIRRNRRSPAKVKLPAKLRVGQSVLALVVPDLQTQQVALLLQRFDSQPQLAVGQIVLFGRRSLALVRKGRRRCTKRWYGFSRRRRRVGTGWNRAIRRGGRRSARAGRDEQTHGRLEGWTRCFRGVAGLGAAKRDCCEHGFVFGLI
uniref:(northern house mosquito) hypothetical protein n=1 Tax=Culex pipiens TaxID=7175 RepID=A0A8D8P2A4_CULPI